MKYEVKRTQLFRKDTKLMLKRGKDIEKLLAVVEKLAAGETLPEASRDHILTGNYSGFRECHIEPDWLLVYRRNEFVLILTLMRTGTHSDLF